MPKPLKPADIHSLNQILSVSGVKQFYAVLEAKGYCYPGWAVGVAGCMGITTIASADYLRGVALMSISSQIFQILGSSQVDKLRFDIAKSYMRLLQRLSREASDAGISRDIVVDEALQVHAEGLERNGLGIENWNLYYPLAILKRLAGVDAAEQFWSFLRDTRRRPSHVGILAALATIAFMYKQTMAGDLKCRQMASAWLSRNPSLHSFEEVERKLDASLRALDHPLSSDIVGFLEVLDLEADGLGQGVEHSPQAGRGGALALARSGCSGHPAVTGIAGTAGANPASTAVYKALLKRLTS